MTKNCVFCVHKNKESQFNTMKLIKEIYTNTSMRVKANGELSDNIIVTKCIRQRNSLSAVKCSYNEIINVVKHMKEYSSCRSVFNTFYYTDDILIVKIKITNTCV